MRLLPCAAQPAPSSTPTPLLVRLNYVIRAPQHATKSAEIDAYVAADGPTTRVTGSFDDAVAVARRAAATTVLDGLHKLPINPAQAVLSAGEGAWLVAPLVGDHRGATGPLFVDGDFFRRAGLAVWAQRLTGGAPLAAVVGVDNLLDMRNGRTNAGVSPLPVVASTPAA